MFIVIAVGALTGLLVALIMMAAFSRASRRDALYAPASGARARWARRVAGMYIRDDYTERRDEYTGYNARLIERPNRTGEDELVGR
ncbi:hypothetical protein SMC26_01985 [Actinomadura fulvescens]|uniref:Secreted protein n=1 Tax=Actinomadura fulvescens TaxID=46160 RepID=A0ABN3PLP7_9ACTN